MKVKTKGRHSLPQQYAVTYQLVKPKSKSKSLVFGEEKKLSWQITIANLIFVALNHNNGSKMGQLPPPLYHQLIVSLVKNGASAAAIAWWNYQRFT